MQASKVVLQPLLDHKVLETVCYQKKLLLSSYGPKGRLKIIGSEILSEMVIGSSSSVLLSAPILGEKEPIIALITSAVSQHLKTHFDAGLFAKVFCLSLVESGLKLDVPCSVTAQCYRKFSEDILQELSNTVDSPVVSKVDIAKLQPFLDLIQGILQTKPSVCFSKLQIENLSILLLKAFMHCSCGIIGKNAAWPILHFQVTNCGRSELFYGLLLDVVHHSKDSLVDLFDSFQYDKNKKLNVILLDVALTLPSLVGSLPHKQNQSKLHDQVMNYMLSFTQKIISSGVNVVLNQKVMDDWIKRQFRIHNILVIDRIGGQTMNALQKVTQAMVVGCLGEDVSACKGKIDGISLQPVNDKLYVLIENRSFAMSSLVVCSSSEQCLRDLKHVSWASLYAIDKTLTCQKVLAGGGNCELYLSQYLQKQYSVERGLQEIPCSLGQFLVCLKSFCKCLDELGKYLSCDSKTIYDCYETKLHALMVAVQTACIVLEIKFQIKDS